MSIKKETLLTTAVPSFTVDTGGIFQFISIESLNELEFKAPVSILIKLKWKINNEICDDIITISSYTKDNKVLKIVELPEKNIEFDSFFTLTVLNNSRQEQDFEVRIDYYIL